MPMRAILFAFFGAALVLAGCSTVKPQQRAILADPSMQFDSEPHEEAVRRHAIDNREGSMGGGGVSGGGCGCN
jgi:hypothetical protein